MGVLRRIAEGGQTWAHRVRMFHQVVKIAVVAGLLSGAMAFSVKLVLTQDLLFRAAWYYSKALLLTSDGGIVKVQGSTWRRLDPYAATPSRGVSREQVLAVTRPWMGKLVSELQSALVSTSIVSIVSFLAFLVFFLARGNLSGSSRHVSGQRLRSAWKVALRVRLTGKASSLRLGGLPLVKDLETQHLLITGGTGSGKTNCLHHLLPQIRSRGERAIIVDLVGNLVQSYRRDTDTLLNPFDEKASAWHPWIECRHPFDFAAMAEAFIPVSHVEHENYWREAARALLMSLLEKLKVVGRTSELVRWILFEPLPKLCQFVQGTKAGAFLDISSERTAASVRSVAAAFLQCLEHIEGTEAPFSIRQWIENESENSWLFLGSNPSQRALMRPLLGSWLSVAIRGLLSLPPDRKRRVWFVIDELPALNKVKDLETLLAEGRKYGGCGLFSLQSPAQLDTVYGHAGARFLMGNCSTKIVFAENDPEVASRISKIFGEEEVREFQEGISYGAHQVRDGVNISQVKRHRPVVSASDIQSLEANEAFVRLPGFTSVSRVQLQVRCFGHVTTS